MDRTYIHFLSEGLKILSFFENLGKDHSFMERQRRTIHLPLGEKKE